MANHLTRRSVLATTTMAAGLLSAGVRPARAAKTTVVAALTAEPESLDPIYDTQLAALNVFFDTFDQLAATDATGKVVHASPAPGRTTTA